MQTYSPTMIYTRLARLEKELQRLKVKAYLALPEKPRQIAFYSQKAILNALKETRDAIWQERYAKKVARIH